VPLAPFPKIVSFTRTIGITPPPADEVFLSSSGGGVIPIVRVNETIFGNGASGPISIQLNETYWTWTTLEKYRYPINYL